MKSIKSLAKAALRALSKEYLDPLVIRRGYTLTSKTWQDLGIGINPQFATNFQTTLRQATAWPQAS